MALVKFSQFYYGHLIGETNRTIDFREGSTVKTAYMRIGAYTLTEFRTEVSRAMTEAGAQDYTTTLNRTTRRITVSAAGDFELLPFSGPTKGASAFALIGFSNDSDFTGSDSYEGDLASGSVFKPQMLLQGYTPFELWQEKSGASVTKSASGVKETVSFGRIRNMECTIDMVTDHEIGTAFPYEQQVNALQNFIDFLLAATDSQRLEFMPDRDDASAFYKCQLEKCPGYSEGTGFKIQELLREKLPNFYKYGPLQFGELV